jgi:phosphoglycolate phosphatase-like HAD superfamily hydrolase
VHLAIFDIDGTLTDSCAFDDALYAEAVHDVLNVQISCSWGRYRNVTDSGILNELLDLRCYSGCRAGIHTQVKHRFVSKVRRYLEQHTLQEIPGAKDLLAELQRQKAASIAIATGGWRETALLKLQAVGIDTNSIPLATASDSSDRCEILKIAVNRASNGRPLDRTTYFGDGEWDKKAASELGYEFIGVGSKVSHHRVVPDLTDLAAILRQLGV